MASEILSALGKAWAVVKDFLLILKVSRFSLIIVLVAVVALFGVEAIQDILVGLSHPDNWLQKPIFVLAVNWLAFQAWGWARYIFARSFDAEGPDGQGRGQRRNQRWSQGWRKKTIAWLPRVYAIVTFGVAALAAFNAEIRDVGWGMLVVGVAVSYFLFERRNIKMPALRRIARPRVAQYYLTAGVLLISSGLAIITPVGFGNALGAGAVLFLGLGCLIPVGSYLVELSRENGFPVVLAMLLLAIFFSQFNDNHHVRLLDDRAPVARERSLDDYFVQWHAQATPGQPLVLVATAGGGLRATFWTAVVLGRLQDAIAGFHRQVFAISGVSGGSVGAVFYNAALAYQAECLEDGRPCFGERLLDAVGRDYLAPVTASFLYPDLMQRFFPLPWFPDRASALERSWEHGFRDTYPAADCGLDAAFIDLFADGRCPPAGQWAPLLLINGTYEQTGQRILTAPFALQPGVFPDTHDFHRLNGERPIPASTAAHNSARFTYLSPAGTFGDGAGSIIDGGYFENYGAATLADLLRWLKRHHGATLAERGLVVITISNDANIPLAQYDIDAVPAGKPTKAFLNELLAPVRGLLSTRNAHGLLAYKQLNELALDGEAGDDVTWAHFYLGTEQQDAQSVPLTWILSEPVQQYMKQQFTVGENCAAYSSIGVAMEVTVEGC